MAQNSLSSIYGQKLNPFYIYAPRWISSSAGIRVLHYLCHSLNILGYPAYLILTENSVGAVPRVNEFLRTPILTHEIAQSHFRSKLTPITVFSETVPGNPLNAPFVVRYLLNFAGALGGLTSFPSEENLLAYTENIKLDYCLANTSQRVDVLYLPAVDPREISSSVKDRSDYYVAYLGKYDSFVGSTPVIPRDNVKISKRSGPESHTRQDLLDLIAGAKAFITFENTSLITESILLGTPAIAIKNPFLSEIIASKELGNCGMALDFSNEAESIARETVLAGKKAYLETIESFIPNLLKWAKSMQGAVADTTYKECISIPRFTFVVSSHRVRLATQIIKSLGWRRFFVILGEFISRRIRISFSGFKMTRGIK